MITVGYKLGSLTYEDSDSCCSHLDWRGNGSSIKRKFASDALAHSKLISFHFKDPIITILVRSDKFTDADIMITNDNLEKAIAAISTLLATGKKNKISEDKPKPKRATQGKRARK